MTPVVPACLRTWLFGDSVFIPGWMCRADSGRSGRCVRFLTDPGCLPRRPGRCLPGRPEQQRRSGHRPASPDPLGPLALAAPCTGSPCTGSACTGSACSGSACSGSACAGSACSGSAWTDLAVFGSIGSGRAGVDVGGSGLTGSDEVGAAARAEQEAEIASSARRWNAASALAVLPYKRVSFRACRCVSPHSRCLACSRRNSSASAE
jgi:hypothetical protein